MSTVNVNTIKPITDDVHLNLQAGGSTRMLLTSAGSLSATDDSYIRGVHHGFLVRESADQSIAASTYTRLTTLSAVECNGPHGGFSNFPSQSYRDAISAAGLTDHWQTEYQRFKAPVNGVYFFSLCIEMDKIYGHGSSWQYITVEDNGTGAPDRRAWNTEYVQSADGDGHDVVIQTSSLVIPLSTGAIVYPELWISSDGSETMDMVYFSGHLVSAL